MRYILRTPFLQIPARAYAYARRRLENGFMFLGLGLLWVGFASLFFRIIGLQADVKGLMLPLTIQALLLSDVASAVLMHNPVVMLFSALAFAPVVEELIFREFVITMSRGLSASKRQVLILMCSGVVFGLAHGSPFRIMVQGLFGMLLAMLYLRNGPNRFASYASCVFIHASYNFIISVYASA